MGLLPALLIAFFTAASAATALSISASLVRAPGSLRGLARGLGGVDKVAAIVLVEFLRSIVRKMRGLDPDVNVALPQSQKAFTSFVDDLYFDLMELDAKFVERLLNRFLPGIRHTI